MIHTSLSPNTERDDLWTAFKLLFMPWNWFHWKTGGTIPNLERTFEERLGSKHAVSFQRGRDALFVLLQALGIGSGDEVILQAYTCIVVPNAIQYTGAKPVYTDIEEEGFNMDPKSLEKALSQKTKAVIVQHTFGEPTDMEAVQALCKKHHLILIEDGAHSLSASAGGQKVGSFGDAAIWSFGRDKIISGVWGGMLTTLSDELAEKVRNLQAQLPLPSASEVASALFHPLVFALIKPFYASKFGKAVLVLAQKLKLIPKVIFSAEKRGDKPVFMPQRMANAMARLIHRQLNKLQRFHQHRVRLSEFYGEQLKDIPEIQLPRTNEQSAWLRYTIRTTEAADLIRSAQRKGIYLGDWYRRVLAPEGCDLKHFAYLKGSCPRAEKAAEETVNLPTHIQMTEEKAKRVVDFIKEYFPPSHQS